MSYAKRSAVNVFFFWGTEILYHQIVVIELFQLTSSGSKSHAHVTKPQGNLVFS